MRPRQSSRKLPPTDGFSMIELIGVMAILTILAMALVPVLIRQHDRLAREREIKRLQEMSDAFKSHVRRTRSVPSEAEYAAALAGELGWQIDRVLNNEKLLARRFVIHPGLAIGGAGLPYVQTQAGAGVNAPTNVHFLFLSSMGPPLPADLVDGAAATAGAWSNLWNTADGALPADWAWDGQGRDLLIHRLNLDDHFVQVALNYDVPFTVTVAKGNFGRFSIDGSTTNDLHNTPPDPAYGYPFRTHYLLDTVLGLHGHGSGGALQTREVLKFQTAFSYEMDTWRANVFLGRTVRSPGAGDLQDALDLFMRSQWNINAKGSPASTQTVVSNAMVNYMKAFIAWRDASPRYPYSGQLYNDVKAAQTDLASVTADLIFRPLN